MWSAGVLTHCWRECEMAQLFWKPAWQILQKLNIYIPYGPTTLRLDKQDGKWEHMSTTIFIAILFVIAPNWKQPGCTSIGDWLNMEWWMTQLKTRIVNPCHTQMNVSYAEWKKTDKIENRPCDFTSTKFGETQMIESDLTMREGVGRGQSEKTLNRRVRRISEMMDSFHDLDCCAWRQGRGCITLKLSTLFTSV